MDNKKAPSFLEASKTDQFRKGVSVFVGVSGGEFSLPSSGKPGLYDP